MSDEALLQVADRLYAEPLATFTPARDSAAKEAGADRQLAARVKALRKPSTAAWALNLLVRREGGQIDQVLALGEALRVAAESMAAEDLRMLTRQRRQLTHALAGTARELAREHEVRLTDAVVDQVEGTLTAAMLDPVAARVVRTGLVLTAFTATGVSDIDVAAVCAVPEAVDPTVAHQAVATGRPAPSLRLVPEDDRVRRAAAQDRVDEATDALAEVRGHLAEVEREVSDLNARRLQLQGELDELRRRLATLEDDVDAVDDDLEEAGSARDHATIAVEEAEAELAEAQRVLDALDGGDRED